MYPQVYSRTAESCDARDARNTCNAPREQRFPLQENSKLYCLMLTLLVLCGSGILVCVLTAGIIYAVQQSK